MQVYGSLENILQQAHKLHGCDKDLKVSNIYCAVNQKKQTKKQKKGGGVGFETPGVGDYIAQNGSIIITCLI